MASKRVCQAAKSEAWRGGKSAITAFSDGADEGVEVGDKETLELSWKSQQAMRVLELGKNTTKEVTRASALGVFGGSREKN